MEKISLAKGIALISKAFPSNQFDVEFYWEFLKDLEDQDFKAAVISIVKTMKEIYPGTNILAAIREKAIENKRSRISKVRAISDMQCAPPPAEWTEAMEKLKVSNVAK